MEDHPMDLSGITQVRTFQVLSEYSQSYLNSQPENLRTFGNRSPDEVVLSMQELTDPIIRFAAQTLQRAEVFNLRAVSSTFENAVFNTALPAHTAKVTLGVDDDAELQQAAAMTSRVGSRVKGLPITLRAFVEPLSESSFTALKQIAPNVVKIIIMDAASNTSYNCEPWHQVKFPNLRFLRVYAPPNQLYYKPKDVVAILVHSLLKHHGKYLRDFELKNQTNRGAIECVDLRIPSEITSITGTFHEFPEAYFEAAKELSLLVYMNIVCYTPASRDRAEKLIQSLFERWSHTLQILTIECCFVPSTVQLVCSGPFVLIKLIMKDLELLLLDGVCKFGTIFPKLISIEISRLSGSTNEFVEINWIPSILTDMKLRKFHSLSTNGSADMLEHQPLKFFINFPFLRRLTIGFPNIITTQIALQEIFRTSMAIEELSIGCTRSLAERPGLDLNHLLTSVTSADSFRGRSTWKALRQHEHPSISDLKDLRELSLDFEGFDCEITSFLLDSLASIKHFKRLGVQGEIDVPNALQDWFASTGRIINVFWNTSF